MEQVVIALLMMINNEIKEARIQSSLSRLFEREEARNERLIENQRLNILACIKSNAELEKNIDGSWSIKKTNNGIMIDRFI